MRKKRTIRFETFTFRTFVSNWACHDLCVPLYAHEVFGQVSLETDMTISKKDPSLCLFVIEI